MSSLPRLFSVPAGIKSSVPVVEPANLAVGTAELRAERAELVADVRDLIAVQGIVPLEAPSVSRALGRPGQQLVFDKI